jgi:cyanate permease
MVPTVAMVIAPRRSALVKQLEHEAATGEISPALMRRLHDPLLFGVVQTVAVLLLGLIFLMTIKPDLLASIITMGVALLLGLALSIVSGRAKQAGGAKQVEDRSQASLG